MVRLGTLLPPSVTAQPSARQQISLVHKYPIGLRAQISPCRSVLVQRCYLHAQLHLRLCMSVSGFRCHGQAPMLASGICHGCLHCHIHVNQELDWLVQVLHMHVEPEQVPQVANGSVVGLIASRGGSADGSVAQQRCLGLGIVRSVDPVQDFLYLLTPVPAEQLQQVRYMSWLVYCLHSRCTLQACCLSYMLPVTASLCMPARCQAQRLCGTGGPPADGTIRASASTSARQERVVPIPGYGVLDSYRHRCWACAPSHRSCTAQPHSPSLGAHAVHANSVHVRRCSVPWDFGVAVCR